MKWRIINQKAGNDIMNSQSIRTDEKNLILTNSETLVSLYEVWGLLFKTKQKPRREGWKMTDVQIIIIIALSNNTRTLSLHASVLFIFDIYKSLKKKKKNSLAIYFLPKNVLIGEKGTWKSVGGVRTECIHEIDKVVASPSWWYVPPLFKFSLPFQRERGCW